MATLDEIVENSLYTEVKKLRNDISIVMDPSKDKLYLKKVLDVFSVPVFEYLQSHTDVHVPRVKIFWEEEDRLVVIEEYIQGTTLEELLESGKDFSGKPFTFDELKRILLGLCDGLIFLHSANPPIIHRDIKASNVIITDDGLVKIIDYNAAKQFTQGKKKDTVLIGTQGIAAPEQYGFAQSDERTDIYALGKLMERMLSDAALEESKETKRLAKVVEKSTKLQPELRYKSVSEMKSAIEKPSKKGLALAGVALLVAALVLFIILPGNNSGKDTSDSKQSVENSSEETVNEDASDQTEEQNAEQNETIDDTDPGLTDVELNVKYLEGTNQTIPSPDDYDMLIVKIDINNISEYVWFDTEIDKTVLDSNAFEYAVLKSKMHDKGWYGADQFYNYIYSLKNAEPDSPMLEDAEYMYTLTGDMTGKDMEDYNYFGISVTETTGNYETTASYERSGNQMKTPNRVNAEYTGFVEATGYLIYVSDKIATYTDDGKIKCYDYKWNPILISE